MPLRALAFAIPLLLLMPAFAVAQSTAPASQPTPSTAPQAPSSAQVSRLISTLQDPAARQQLIDDLQTLLAAEQKSQPKPEASPVDAAGAELLEGLSDGLAMFGQFFQTVGRGIGDPSYLLNWLRQQIENPSKRAVWAEVLWKLIVVLGGGGLAGWLVGRGVRRVAQPMEQRRTPTVWHKAPLLLARLFLDLVPIVTFAAAAYAVLIFVDPGRVERLVSLAAINAGIVASVATAATRMVFCPFAPSLRLFRMDDESAAYAYVWIKRLIQFGVYGYFTLQAAVLLGLPRTGYHVAFKLYGLLIALLLVVLVLQNRDWVAEALRGHRPPPGPSPGPPQGNGIRTLRRRLSEIWHILAIFYIGLAYLVWAMGVRGGFDYILRSTAMTFVIVLLARGVVALARRSGHRILAINQDLLRRYPLIEQRADRYLPFLRRGLLVLLQVVALFAILAAWKIDVGTILQSELGRQVLGRLVSIAVVLGLSLLVWEIASGMITIYLQRRDESGQVLLRSARARTLLPLVRNALLVLISVMALLTSLSQLGIDIGPLLAGAGVVGLAIGFGAQTLVKDVITGAFILFEDTVSIGDVATINGTGGLVEGMTIRTIRLRDLTGTVHTIPFGSINAISNLTKDYSYYLLDVGVAYRENTDEVLAVMQQIFEEQRKDPKYASSIIGDFEILGVDRFADSAVYVRARIKTLPIKQWEVGREYNRRLKLKFDELGIEIPFPHQTIYFGVDKQGKAPPVHIQSLEAPGDAPKGPPEAAAASAADPKEAKG